MMKSIKTEVFQVCSSSKSNRLNLDGPQRCFGSCLGGWFGWRLHSPRTGGCRIWGETPSRVCCTCYPRCAKIPCEVLVCLIFGSLGLILHWEKSTCKIWLVPVWGSFSLGIFLVMSKREGLADYNDHSCSKLSGCLAFVNIATCHLCYPWQLAQVLVNHEEGRYMVGYLRAVNDGRISTFWSMRWCDQWFSDPYWWLLWRFFSVEKTAMFVAMMLSGWIMTGAGFLNHQQNNFS